MQNFKNKNKIKCVIKANNEPYFIGYTKIYRIVILTPTEEITTEEPKAYVNLPYINGTSNILQIIFNEYNIKSTFTSKETLRKILSHLISSKRQTLSRKEK